MTNDQRAAIIIEIFKAKYGCTEPRSALDQLLQRKSAATVTRELLDELRRRERSHQHEY